MEELKLALQESFAGNFVAYTRSHFAHLNVTGRNFYSDHKLLQKIYEYFQANIDTIGEKIRSCRFLTPADIATVTMLSPVMDFPVVGSADSMLELVDESLEQMIDQYHRLNDAAEAVGYIDISNFAQDQIGQLAKFRWMVESTLGADEHEE